MFNFPGSTLLHLMQVIRFIIKAIIIIFNKKKKTLSYMEPLHSCPLPFHLSVSPLWQPEYCCLHLAVCSLHENMNGKIICDA